MRSSGHRAKTPQPTRWEIVGAWLRIWTAPKDVEVPPVPKRKLAIWGLVLAAAVAIGLALLIPPLEKGKRAGAALLAKQQAVTVAAETARLRADQRVHRELVASGQGLVAQLQAAITGDAKARDRAGTLEGPVLSTKCSAAGASVVIFRGSRVYKCFVTTAAGLRGQGKDVIGTGYPFVATVYPKTHKLAWCKQNPRPDEKTRGHGLAEVRLSPECAGRLAEVL